jgi:hypothetical protein
MKCFYGQGILHPSTLEEYDRCESGSRIIDHINHPEIKGVEESSISSIWLKTFGLRSFMIECPTSEVESVIQSLNLVRT